MTTTSALAEGAAAPPIASFRTARTRPNPALVVTALVIGALFAIPLVYLVWHDAGLGTALVDIVRDEDVGGPLRRTLVLAAAVAVAASAIGTALAWLLTRTDVPARRMWRVVVPLPLVIPSFVGAFTLIAAFAPGGLADTVFGFGSLPRVEGFWAAAIVLTLLTYPYVYLPVSARLQSLPPSLEESARALGRGPREVFRTVVLPQVSGAVWAGALLVFLYTLSEFGAVQLLHYDTLTRAIFAARLFDRDVALTLSLLLALVALVVVAAERLLALRRLDTEAVATESSTLQNPLGLWRWPALVFVGGVVTLALVIPVLVLAHWTLRGILGDAELDAGDLVGPAVTTAGLGIAAAIAAVVAVLPVAVLTVRYRSRIGEVANAVIVSGFALPGLVLALSLVFFVVQSPVSALLYQTFTLLVFAYVVHFGSQALRAGQVAVGGVPRRMDDAARSLGAGRVRRFTTVHAPLMRPGLLAGGALVMLSTMKELPATLVLAPPGTRTLATEIWSATGEGFFAKAGLASLVLVALSTVLTWLITVRPERARA